MNTSEDMSNHFAEVSNVYNAVRDTDRVVLDLIAQTIKQVNSPISLDFATGTGRYPISIAKEHGHKFLCTDKNPEMLEKIQEEYTEGDGLIRVIRTNGLEGIEKPDSGYRVITLMNALHHFDDIPSLVKSVSEIISDEGYFLIYTRLDNQNTRTIWGQHFPEFDTRENRYLGRSAFPYSQLEEKIIEGGMKVENVKTFELKRLNTLPELLEKVEKMHYSTFRLYSPKELNEAKSEFVKNIHQAFLGSINNEYKIEHISPMSMIFATKNVDNKN
jgi:ubiquinone/menaquinone biosynthesis C-methylase UbiE|tara:strand:- start:19024 stop:19842 length:819 start_codon:yes stop_codon:yes gene_type:complete